MTAQAVDSVRYCLEMRGIHTRRLAAEMIGVFSQFGLKGHEAGAVGLHGACAALCCELSVAAPIRGPDPEPAARIRFRNAMALNTDSKVLQCDRVPSHVE